MTSQLYKLSITLLFVGACMGKKKFDKQNAEERCQLLEDCEVLDMYGYSSINECDDELRNTYNECDDYDKKAAKECIDELKKMNCQDVYDERFPPACGHACKDAPVD